MFKGQVGQLVSSLINVYKTRWNEHWVYLYEKNDKKDILENTLMELVQSIKYR